MSSFKSVHVRDGNMVAVPKDIVRGVLSSYHEMESYVATLEVLLDEKLLEDLQKAKSEVKRGEYVDARLSEVDELLK